MTDRHIRRPRSPAFNHSREDSARVPCEVCAARMSREALLVAYLEARRTIADMRDAAKDRDVAETEWTNRYEVGRQALTDALDLYDEKPGHPEWAGCLCPAGRHADDCIRARYAALRALVRPCIHAASGAAAMPEPA